jgi:LmbE family N-acetylglucosaminyl deacetylase
MKLERRELQRKRRSMTVRESVAVLVAHPDDETLWAGGTLLSEATWDPFVWCACRAKDSDRAPKFHRVLEWLGACGAMADLDDSPEQPPLADQVVEEALLDSLPTHHFHRILTHSPLGEYTRHQRHEDVGRAVLGLWLRGTLSAAELWLFAYDDQGGSQLPRALENADIRFELSTEVWERKHRLITHEYGFAEASWEARATPRTEGFFRVTTSERAAVWLARRRSK